MRADSINGTSSLSMATRLRNRLFYSLKPVLPRRFQILLRRAIVKAHLNRVKSVWPINENNATAPPGFSGWPNGKKFAFITTHDVEFQRGADAAPHLMEIEKELGFVSAFNFVPERYSTSPALRQKLEDEGFEVGVHDLNHDGRLFQDRRIFEKRYPRINSYLREWKAAGFRSGATHRNLDWIYKLKIEYDASCFENDPFEPQPGDANSIFPFLVADQTHPAGYIELPYTLPQDFTVFVILAEKNLAIWQKKLDWIAAKGGMALFISHPDYMAFDGRGTFEQYPVAYYTDFLRYVKERYANEYWNALPRDAARFWRQSVVQSSGEPA